MALLPRLGKKLSKRSHDAGPLRAQGADLLAKLIVTMPSLIAMDIELRHDGDYSVE